MVIRSLIFKVYVYTAVAFFLSLPLTFWVGHQLMDIGRREGVQHFVSPMLGYVERELERTWQGQPPDPTRLAELGQAFRHEIRFVPWSAGGSYPAELGEQNTIVDDRRPERGRGPRHWLRIDRGGSPVGAVSLTPAPGRGGPPGGPGGPPPRGPFGPMPPQVAWTWVVMLVVLVVPPLWIWVIRPLRQMAATARRLGSGDLETPVAVRRRDEFGELERAFEGMRVELRRLIEQKERLLTDVSHEIRGPLARMTLALPLLRQEGASGPITELFGRELQAADDLLGEVLALSRGQRAPVMAPTDLAVIARQLVEERAIPIEHREQRLDLHLDAAPVMGDERLLARALGNLLDNALKYTPPGGHITVQTGATEGQSLVRIGDDGPGIAAEHLPHVFEPFYRPDDSRSRETGGTGLGLAIVRTIAESHGGTVTLESPGKGTVAELRLPTPVAPDAPRRRTGWLG